MGFDAYLRKGINLWILLNGVDYKLTYKRSTKLLRVIYVWTEWDEIVQNGKRISVPNLQEEGWKQSPSYKDGDSHGERSMTQRAESGSQEKQLQRNQRKLQRILSRRWDCVIIKELMTHAQRDCRTSMDLLCASHAVSSSNGVSGSVFLSLLTIVWHAYAADNFFT